MPLVESHDGLGLPFLDPREEPLGNADRLVQIADLGLVVPEHRQSTQTADALQPRVEDLTATAAREDQSLPDVAKTAVFVVEALQPLQVRLIRKRPGDFVRERPAPPAPGPAEGQGDDEPRSRPIRSNSPVSRACRSTTRTPLKIRATASLVAVAGTGCPWPGSPGTAVRARPDDAGQPRSPARARR